jgi:signal transduction histidine kinase
VKRRWTIRQLLLGVNLFILLVPFGAIALLQVLDAYLLRQTERQLIAESVVIGEAWRDRLLDELDLPPDSTPEIRPRGLESSTFTPHRPLLDLGYDVLPPAADPTRHVADAGLPVQRAGAAVVPLLERAQVFNLSGARVLDAQGCVVATSGAEQGACLDHLEEVREALAGRYSAVVRRRLSNQPTPPLTSIRRRGKLRVFSATPIVMNGQVAGVVRMSRTSVSPVELLWAHRGKVGLVLGIVLLITPVSSYMFSHAISKPVRALTRRAEAMARGRSREEFVPGRLAPREVQILSDALNRMTRKLTEQTDYIMEFSSNVSHELKSPLTGIGGAVELLQDEWSHMSEEQRRRFLENISQDALRMERLVTDLLHLARIESTPEDNEEDVDLAAFLGELSDRFDAEIRIDLSRAPRSIRINRDRLETVLRNLVHNAARHGKDHPVDVGVAALDGRFVFTVRDRGGGIPEGDQSRVFDRFFTTEREHGGTGLGLSIVQAVARARGGSVTFDTGPRGTTFRVVL